MRQQHRGGAAGLRRGNGFQQVAGRRLDGLRAAGLQPQRQLVSIEQGGVLAQFEHDAGIVVRALRRIARRLRGQPLRRRLRLHLAMRVLQCQTARAERGLAAIRTQQRRLQQRPQRGKVDVFVLHAGQREQVVAAQVAHVLQPDAERAHQPVGGQRARLAAADQLDLQLPGQLCGERRRCQQA